MLILCTLRILIHFTYRRACYCVTRTYRVTRTERRIADPYAWLGRLIPNPVEGFGFESV